MSKKVIRMKKNGPKGIGLENIPQQNPESIVEGDPQEKEYSYYVSDDEMLYAGVWESSPGKLVVESTSADEYCCMLSGKLIITNHADNSEEVFTAGDSFFVPKGTALTWDMPETIRKFYVIRSYD